MSVTRKWSFLAAVLVLAILAAGWFLLVSPKRSEAAALAKRTVREEDANARLLQQLAVLKAQQADLPEQRAQLAVMRKQIPNNPALPTLIRDLTAAGRKAGVSIDTMAPAVPVAVVVPVTAPVATTSEDSTSTGTTGTSESSDATVATTPAPPALFQVPLTLDVSGSYFELEQYVNKLEGFKRSFLVSGFTLASATGGSAASGGATGTGTSGPAAGDLTLTLQGRVFLAPNLTAAPTPPTPVASAPAAQ